jgi:hypothetical protein
MGDTGRRGYGAGVRNYNLVQTVEAFSSDHSETIDTIMFDWPASKFEALYEAYAKRKIADSLSARRDIEISALWGNTNMDNEKTPNLRQDLMNALDDQYSNAIAYLYGEIDPAQDETDWDDPFLAPTKQKMEEMRLPKLSAAEAVEGDDNG